MENNQFKEMSIEELNSVNGGWAKVGKFVGGYIVDKVVEIVEDTIIDYVKNPYPIGSGRDDAGLGGPW